MNLKIIVDILGSMLAILNLGVILFLKQIYEFFKDPARGLLQFGIFLLNGFIGAIESLGNLIAPGEPFKLGRFRSDVVGEQLDAGASLTEALKKGFLSEEEYQQQKIVKALLAGKKQEEAYLEQLRVDDARIALAKTFAEETNASLIPAVAEGGSAFLKFWNNFIKETNKMNKAVTGRAATNITLGAGFVGPASPSQLLGEQRRQTVTTSDRDARAYNYLTGLGR